MNYQTRKMQCTQPIICIACILDVEMWLLDAKVEADECELACAGLGGLNYWISNCIRHQRIFFLLKNDKDPNVNIHLEKKDAVNFRFMPTLIFSSTLKSHLHSNDTSRCVLKFELILRSLLTQSCCITLEVLDYSMRLSLRFCP